MSIEIRIGTKTDIPFALNLVKELAAYEKGRLHEETVLLKWIKDWDGSTNSAMGELLKDKFNQLNKTKH